MSDTLRNLESAEVLYLLDRGWLRWDPSGCLWIDPQAPAQTHIARVAAYKQRQRDAAKANAKR